MEFNVHGDIVNYQVLLTTHTFTSIGYAHIMCRSFHSVVYAPVVRLLPQFYAYTRMYVVLNNMFLRAR